jgi:plastocyanin
VPDLMRSHMRKPITIATVLIAAVALALTPATGLAKTKNVKVGDDYYAPTKVNIKKNDKVKFKWLDLNINPHNVVLKKGPKGVKKSKKACTSGKITKCNKSATGAIGIKFTPKFNKKGKYNFHCTIHPTTMKVKVIVGK